MLVWTANGMVVFCSWSFLKCPTWSSVSFSMGEVKKSRHGWDASDALASPLGAVHLDAPSLWNFCAGKDGLGAALHGLVEELLCEHLLHGQLVLIAVPGESMVLPGVPLILTGVP